MPEPSLSVVLLSPGGYEYIRKTMRHLRAQHARLQLEVILGAPDLSALQPDEQDRTSFHTFKLIEVGPIRSTGEPRAIAARAASAPAIVFAEDHCFPEPEWADALIEAFQNRFGAVGATLSNNNPDTALSWASLMLNFGPNVMVASSGEADVLPWHNSGYRADLLRAYSLQELGRLLETEGLLQADIVRQGHKLFLCAGARAAHTNVSKVRSFASEQFYGSRLFWLARANRESWPLGKRLGFAVATPGLAAVRLLRALGELNRIGMAGSIPRLLPLLTLGVTAITLGGAAILLGPGGTMQFRISAEFHRYRHLRQKDLAFLTV